MAKERLTYIDVAKGLLMVLVVFHHVDGNATLNGITSPAVDDIHAISNLFVSFFIPCFFIITGYCSNFTKPFKEFIIGSFKSILLPAFFFTFLFSGFWHIHTWSLSSFAKQIIIYGGDYWFLTALFLSRVIYWIVSRYCRGALNYIIVFSSFIVGFLLCHVSFTYEYWYFIHVLLLMPFLALGNYLRMGSIKIKMDSVFSIPLYIIILALTILLFRLGILQKDSYFDVPAITYTFINLNYTTLLPLVLLIISGYFAIIQLSKRIRSNRILEYIGKNSLVIYCVHNLTLFLSIRFIYKVGGAIIDSYLLNIVFLISSFLVTIVISCFVAWIMNFKYVRLLIGKF